MRAANGCCRSGTSRKDPIKRNSEPFRLVKVSRGKDHLVYLISISAIKVTSEYQDVEIPQPAIVTLIHLPLHSLGDVLRSGLDHLHWTAIGDVKPNVGILMKSPQQVHDIASETRVCQDDFPVVCEQRNLPGLLAEGV